MEELRAGTMPPSLHLETACSDHPGEALVVGTDERDHLAWRRGKGLAGSGGGELFGELGLRDHRTYRGAQARDNLRRSCRGYEQCLPYRDVISRIDFRYRRQVREYRRPLAAADG